MERTAKQLFSLIILLLSFTFTASAQTVTVTQETADRAAACFTESKAKDQLLDAKNSELKAVYGEKQAVVNESAANEKRNRREQVKFRTDIAF